MTTLTQKENLGCTLILLKHHPISNPARHQPRQVDIPPAGCGDRFSHLSRRGDLSAKAPQPVGRVRLAVLTATTPVDERRGGPSLQRRNRMHLNWPYVLAFGFAASVGLTAWLLLALAVYTEFGGI